MADTNWTSALLAGAGLWDQLDRYDELGDNIVGNLDQMATDAIDGTQFTGFNVAGYGGGANVGPDGSVQINMDDAQAAQAGALTGYADQFFASAAGDQSQREQDAYDRIRATQLAEEEQQYYGLESRLAAQGRLGMASDQYGSTPEMLAYQKAVQDNKNNASLAAITQAMNQQAQDATIGTQFQSNAFLPQAQLMNLLNPGMQGAQLGQAGQLAGMNLASQLGLGAMQTQVNSEKIRGELLANLLGTAGGALTNSGVDPVGQAGSWIWDQLQGILGINNG